MHIIEITEDTCEKLSECAEEIMQSAKNLMSHLGQMRSRTSEDQRPRPHRDYDDRDCEDDDRDYEDDDRQPAMRSRKGWAARRGSYSRY